MFGKETSLPHNVIDIVMVIILTFICNKKIKVGVIFEENREKMIPKWFIREGRQYKIDQVTYMWEEKKGSGLIKHFAVLSENISYELTYDVNRMAWRLIGVDDES